MDMTLQTLIGTHKIKLYFLKERTNMKKSKTFFFFYITLIILSSIIQISNSNAETNNIIFASDHLNVSAYKFNNQDFNSGVYGKLNVRPYGIYLNEFKNLGSTPYNDKIVYTARLEFKFYLNIYTSALMTDIFSITRSTDTGVYMTTHARPNWTQKWVTQQYLYQFQNFSYIIKSLYNYNGMIDIAIDMNENLIKYNDTIISNLDFNLQTIKAGHYQSGIVGDYENIIQTDVYDPGFSAEGYNTNNDFEQINRAAGDARNEISSFLADQRNVAVTPLRMKNETIQNFVSTPLTYTENVNIVKNDGNSGIFRIPVNIRPQISVYRRDIYVNQLDLWYDSECEFLGGCGIIDGSTTSRALITAPYQNLAVDVINPFYSDEMTVVFYASAKVEKSYFEEEKIDFQDPRILQGDWVWDGTGLVGGGGITIGDNLAGYAITGIIGLIVILALAIYFGPQIMSYFSGYTAGKKRGSD